MLAWITFGHSLIKWSKFIRQLNGLEVKNKSRGRINNVELWYVTDSGELNRIDLL